jgi:HTH-type transcriptional regulator/antitoxin HigA
LGSVILHAQRTRPLAGPFFTENIQQFSPDDKSGKPLPDPIEAIRYTMDSRGLSRRDLKLFIGSRARLAEVLNCKRALTLDMIRRLHAGLGVPVDMLV